MNFYEECERKAINAVEAALALPPIPANEMYSDGECFDPWDLFPALYGSYSSEFDQLAIDVLTDIHDGKFRRQDLASEMFREMLCTAGLCDYGSSPRGCFATVPFAKALPKLIARWREYYEIKWSQ